ncbi:hypothetical protein KVH22_29910 [Streptomyces olivaceus]|uniref:hypothetical protein n=1 Tax=Streptomyces olivaceus TaxID=47716 RepID=UPI001CCE2C00|nr:hypothetical protein [Streptomyces olivaceus]MBZ6259735.1 hypothetical protein [Streptomyces olivaceus]
MIVADALAALWDLGYAFLAWLLIAAAIGTALLLGTIAGVWWICRALRRAARPHRTETT